MKLELEWTRPIPLKSGTSQGLIYTVELEKIPRSSGVYVFGRQYGKNFEALYVGKANKIRGRVKGQLNNLHLVQHLKNAKPGRRIVLIGRYIAKPGQKTEKCLTIIERTLIRHFLSEGHDIANIQGTRRNRHELSSFGKYRKQFIPRVLYIEKRKGE